MEHFRPSSRRRSHRHFGAKFLSAGPLQLALVLSILPYFSWTTAAPPSTHSSDCSANQRLRCRVEEGLCAANPQSDDYPSAPYDLRVSPYLVSNPSRKPDSFQLWVNVSWRPTHESNINKTRGFELTVVDKDTNRQWCFTFALDDPIWEDRDRYESTRFRFSTMDKFEFGHDYYFELQSLPKPLNQTAATASKRNNFIWQDIITPGHPERTLTDQLNLTGYFEPAAPQETITNYCGPSSARSSHPHASRWIAAFRIVYIQTKMRWIYVEFIAAPPQYCFEEYELRLVDSKSHHMVQYTHIKSEDLIHEMHDNVSVAFGNHTFQNVSLGVYDIGLVPSAYSRTGNRCLCPMPNRVCTCSISVWVDVEMPAPPSVITFTNPCDLLPPVKLPFDCPMENENGTRTMGVGSENRAYKGANASTTVAMLSLLIIGTLIVLVVGAVLLAVFYHRYKRKGTARMYLLPVSATDMEATTNGTVSREMSTVLRPVKLTIIYSHDCLEYERTVRHLVDYLNARCSCDVRVDYLCASDIAANKFDWAYKSILEADRVVLLNSYGAYMRYQAKLVNSQDPGGVTTVVERAEPGPFDDLFLLQLDLLIQECQKNSGLLKKFVSARFPFTSEQCVLPHANPYIRYELPKHFRSLIIDLHRLPLLGGLEDDAENETSMPEQLKRANKEDYYKCVEGGRLKESIEAMTRFVHDRSNWFENLHVRKKLTATTKDSVFDMVRTSANDGLLENSRLSYPVADVAPEVPSVNQMDEAVSPLLDRDPNAAKSAGDAGGERTKRYDDSVDSGVGVSSTKQPVENSGDFYSPKRLKSAKENGVIGGSENDPWQRLIT